MYSCAAISALVRPWATRVTSSRSRALSCPGPGAAGCGGPGSVSMRAYSAAVARFIAVPRSSAARARPGPSACRAWRSCSSRRVSDQGGAVRPWCWSTAAHAAHSVRASAARPVAAHSSPHWDRPVRRSSQLPVRAARRSPPAGAPRRRRCGPPAGPGPRSWAAGPPGSAGRPRPGPGPGPPHRRVRLRPGPRHRPARWSAHSCTVGRVGRGSRS